MHERAEVYCYRCGRRIDDAGTYCRFCGAALTLSRAERTLGVAYVLNELGRAPVLDVVSPMQLGRLRSYYGDVMDALTGRTRAAALEPAPVAVSASPASAMVVGQTRARIATARPPRPPAPPREPMDWSWLVEQQANLFLFAGAFLTVVAALIYVGYSGQAVDGALKMSLLVLYTVAFLAAGVVCLRIPRVAIAGRVFFGVGAVLVPLNFVAAQTLLTDESLSITTMWLLGSVVTAAFYGAVACLGLGKPYAFSSGVAIVSATLAAVVRTTVPLEWAPPCFVVVATAMSLAEITAPKVIRERVGAIWGAQSRVVVLSAMAAALLIAPFVGDEAIDRGEAARWFLPLTFGMFAAYAALIVLSMRDAVAGLAAMAGLAGAITSLSYAAHHPAEYYPFGFVAVAMIFGYASVVAREEHIAGRLPGDAGEALHAAALGAAAIAGLIAVLAVVASADAERGRSAYEIQSRWFLPVTFLALALYGAIPMLLQRRREGAIAAITGLVGAAITVVYAMHWPAEYYAVGSAVIAVVLEVARRASLQNVVVRRLPAEIAGILHGYAVAAAAAAIVVGVSAAAIDAGNANDPGAFAVQTRWFLPAMFALVAAYGALAATARRQEDALAMIAGFGGAAITIVYAMHWPAEYYAVAAGGLALVLAVAGLVASRTDVAVRIAPDVNNMLRAAGYGASFAAAAVVLSVLYAGRVDGARYIVDSRWFMLAAFVPVVGHFAVDAFGRREREGVAGLVLSSAAACAAMVYGLDVSYEYYAFAALVPALFFASAARLASVRAAEAEQSPLPRLAARLAGGWRDDALMCTRVLVAAGAVAALGAVWAADQPSLDFAPQFRAFLPVGFVLSAACLAIDASVSRRVEISAAFVIAVIATVVAMPYVFEADAAYYGAAFALGAIAVAFGGRVVDPAWLDRRGRDVLAAAAMTVAWLPFEGAYVDAPRVGAGVHFTAAIFYALAAMFDRGEMTLGRFLDLPAVRHTNVSVAWLYAAGLVAALGYLHALNGIGSGDETIESGTIAVPMFTIAIALWVAGVGARRMRPDFRIHFYLMSLVAALVSLSVAADARTLMVLLTSYVAMSVLIAALDDQPMLGAPAALFGVAAIGVWQRELGVASWSVPAALSFAGVAMCGMACVLPRRWLLPLMAVGVGYAAIAPAAGFAMLAYQGSGDVRYYESSIYEYSTIALAVLGALVTAASARTRRWLALPGSAIVVGALLFQIGRFHPENAQAYTAVIGAYLVLVGTFGLSKLRLAPSLVAVAPFVEGAGAAIVMLPSFLQSFEAGWRYDWIFLAEASAFFIAGIALRRRGLLSVSVTALVLVAVHALFDAVNALPNWVVVATAGAAMLGIGMGILVGRDRWSIWQESVVRWWGDAAGSATNRHV